MESDYLMRDNAADTAVGTVQRLSDEHLRTAPKVRVARSDNQQPTSCSLDRSSERGDAFFL